MPAPRPIDLPADAPWPLARGIRWAPYANGSPRFQIFSRAGGVKKYVDCTPYYDHALQLLHDHEVQVAARQLVGEEEKRRATRLTLREALGQWVAMLRASGFPSADKYADNIRVHTVDELVTVADDSTTLRKFGDVRLDKITSEMILRWRNALLVKPSRRGGGRTLGAGTINNVHKTLGSAFTWFKKSKMIATDPTNDADTLKVATRPKTIIENRRQVTELLRECYTRGGQDLLDIILLLVTTGLRISEALYLRRRKVDLDHVEDGIPLPRFTVEGKGDKTRALPVFDVILPMMQRRMAQNTTHSLLFPGKAHQSRKPLAKQKHPNRREVREPLRPGEFAHSRNGIREQFRDALAAYNAKHPHDPLDERVRLHDTRHTFGTHSAEIEGGDARQLQALMGHADFRTTEGYSRMSMRGFANALGRGSGLQVPDCAPRQLPAGKGEAS